MSEELEKIKGSQKKKLFGRDKPIIPQVNEDVANVSRRLRILEGRFTNLRSKIQVMDQNILHHNRKQTTEFKTINSDVHDLKKKINYIEEKMDLIIKELQDTAKKEDVEVLQKYINLWEPLNFITRKEFEKLLNEFKKSVFRK